MISENTKEEIQELLTLPDSVLVLHWQAVASEVFCRIFRTFGFDCSFLDREQQDKLVEIVLGIHYMEGLPVGRSSCIGFCYYVRDNGGAESFGLNPSVLSEWI